ncbi:MAG TPA: hypothetical protein IAC41_02290 [Candidatus Merdenecus merdavium]|nr:hypothetical protein [Candidatus Merdenecus merdavium]
MAGGIFVRNFKEVQENGKEIVDLGCRILKSVKIDDTESIQVNVTNYDDGSRSVSIEISYPPNKDEYPC